MRILLLVALVLVSCSARPSSSSSSSAPASSSSALALEASSPAPTSPSSRAVRLFWCWEGTALGCEPSGSLVYPSDASCELEEPASEADRPTADERAACDRDARRGGPASDPPGVVLSCVVRARCIGRAQ